MERKVLRKSKPHLRHKSPIIYYISWAYGVTNLFIGAGTFHTPYIVLAKIYPFVRHPFTPQFYGAIFFTMGVVGIISLLLQKWNVTRRVMIFGLMVKSLFFYGLMINLSWAYLGITAIWALITITQFVTVVYFPRQENESGSD